MSQETNHPFGGRAAAVLGGILLAGFALLSVAAALDRSERAQLETLEEPSAAGDPVVYRLPEASPDGEEATQPPSPILTREGVPLFGHGSDDTSDGKMMKAGHDDTGKIPLYRKLKRGENSEEYYVKLAPGEYLELKPTPRKPKHKKD